MTERVLVTGGAGFIGSHLCRRLLRDGHQVICLDNFFTGTRANIEELLGQERFECIEHDVKNPIELEVSRIYALACPASPVHYQTNPIRTVKTCFLGALHALGLARRTGARMLQASTSEVYGDPEEHPQKESYRGRVSCTGPRACYDEGKRVAETLCFDYERKHGLDVRVARIFNTYGPRMQSDDGRVVSNFIVQALRGVPLTIYGDGTQTRSFCFVDDLVDGLVRLMDHPRPLKPVNLGNPGELTVRELADLVLDKTGSPSGISFKPAPADDPTRRKPDITVAKRELGWEPHIPLTRGLDSTIAFFKEKVSVACP